MNAELSNDIYNWTVGLYLDSSKGASLSTDQDRINNFKSIENGCKDIFKKIEDGSASDRALIDMYCSARNMYLRLTQENKP